MKYKVFVSSESECASLTMPHQIHSTTVIEVRSKEEQRRVGDAIITHNPHITLGVHTRDCAPICFGDDDKVAVAHVGWRGLTSGLIENVLLHFDVLPKEVFVGPFLHSFEVKKDECYDEIMAKFGEVFFRMEDGRIIFNFKHALASLLPVHTVWDGRDTEHTQELPSHRHKRTLGHIITTVSLRDETQ